MTFLKYGALLLALSGIAAPLYASEIQQASRSVGKLMLDDSVDLSQLMQQSEVQYRALPRQAEDYASSADADNLAGIANRHDQLFEIYDADVYLGSDFDGDGYYHQIRVTFDIDVSYQEATVYAKLYLSRNGEPWSQYYTTDLFHIDGDSYADVYEVDTELVEGYQPGYYAVLIEVYSLNHAHMVASEVLDYYYLGRNVPLEDLAWDEPYDDYYYEEYSVSYGAGNFSLLFFFLIIQVVIAARGILTFTPCKTKKIKTRNP
jgi:hypothetical protein